jgi:hypothetical protein
MPKKRGSAKTPIMLRDPKPTPPCIFCLASKMEEATILMVWRTISLPLGAPWGIS